MIRSEDKAVLRDFARIAEQNGIPYVLVGAGARLLVFDWQYNFRPEDTTTDWDIGVQISSWVAFEGFQKLLTGGANPAFTEDRVAHRFKHLTGVPIDIIPFGGLERTDGIIVWPQDERQMVVLGFREVQLKAIKIDIGEGVFMPVATLPGLAILKIFSFHDRHLGDDLRDLFFILDNYERAGNEERIFDELTDLFLNKKLEYEFSGAYLLGMDVGRLANPKTIKSLLQIISPLLDPFSPALAPLIRTTVDERQEEKERRRLARKFGVFNAGIKATGKNKKSNR
jgi:predicted nucleotidyltransferase